MLVKLWYLLALFFNSNEKVELLQVMNLAIFLTCDSLFLLTSKNFIAYIHMGRYITYDNPLNVGTNLQIYYEPTKNKNLRLETCNETKLTD